MYCLANSASHGSGACAGRSAKFLSSRLEPLGGFQPRRLQANTSRDGWWHRAGGGDSSSSSWWNNSRGWNDWTWKSSDWSSRSNWRAGASDTYAKPRNHRGKRSLEKQTERIAKGNAKRQARALEQLPRPEGDSTATEQREPTSPSATSDLDWGSDQESERPVVQALAAQPSPELTTAQPDDQPTDSGTLRPTEPSRGADSTAPATNPGLATESSGLGTRGAGSTDPHLRQGAGAEDPDLDPVKVGLLLALDLIDQVSDLVKHRAHQRTDGTQSGWTAGTGSTDRHDCTAAHPVFG